jgi:hypothetical protein
MFEKEDSFLDLVRSSDGIKKIGGIVELDHGDYPVESQDEVIFFTGEDELSVKKTKGGYKVKLGSNSYNRDSISFESNSLEDVLKGFWIKYMMSRYLSIPRRINKEQMKELLGKYYDLYDPSKEDYSGVYNKWEINVDNIFRNIFKENLDYFTDFRSVFSDEWSKNFFKELGVEFSSPIFYANQSKVIISDILSSINEILPHLGSSVHSRLLSITKVSLPYQDNLVSPTNPNHPSEKFKDKDGLINYIFGRIPDKSDERRSLQSDYSGLKYIILDMIKDMYYKKENVSTGGFIKSLTNFINNTIPNDIKNLEKYTILLLPKEGAKIHLSDESIKILSEFIDELVLSDKKDMDQLEPYMQEGSLYKPDRVVSGMYKASQRGM